MQNAFEQGCKMSLILRRLYQRRSIIDILEGNPAPLRLSQEEKLMRMSRKAPRPEYTIDEAMTLLKAHSIGFWDSNTIKVSVKCNLDNAL